MMDCTSTRWLLSFVRTGELDPAEREVLDSHLGACAECAATAQAETRFDDALEVAMARVPMPAGLKVRILRDVRQRRPRRRWPWVAAAAVLIGAAIGGYLVWSAGPLDFDVSSFVWYVDYKTPQSRETVEARFNTELGIAMKAPPEFDFNLLDNYDTAEIQGRRVPKLTFHARGSGALAYVYVLATRQFTLPPQPDAVQKDGWLSEVIPASSHNVQIRRYQGIDDFFYVIVYTSGSLDPFVFPGI